MCTWILATVREHVHCISRLRAISFAFTSIRGVGRMIDEAFRGNVGIEGNELWGEPADRTEAIAVLRRTVNSASI